MSKGSSIALRNELEKLVAQFLKDGYTEETILATFKKVFENMRDPQPEIKGEMDT